MNFTLHILGSNSALPTYESFSTSQILTVNDTPYLIDCAEGAQIQIRRFYSRFSKISDIFISHLHGDHYYGLFGLLSSFNLIKRIAPINIYADEVLEKMLRSELSPINTDNLSFKVSFFYLPDDFQLIHSDKNVDVYSFPLFHRIKTRGFLFKEKQKPANIKKTAIEEYNLTIEQIKAIKKGEDLLFEKRVVKNKELTIPAFKARSFAFCSDTAYFEPIIETVKDVDLLYHESTFLDEQIEHATEVFHSTAGQAGQIAKAANVKNLLIGHFSQSIANRELFLRQAKSIFPQTFLAKDGLEIEITKEHEIKYNNQII